MTTRRVAAVDIGAGSGRVMLATVSEDHLDLIEVHRFANRPVRVGGTLHWDVLALYAGVLDGLKETAGHLDGEPLDGIGIDTWAVDYGLLGPDGSLVGLPVHYRDARTDGISQKVAATVGAAELYNRTGIQDLPFNTVNQLVAERSGSRLQAAERMLLVPDLLTYWLTGAIGAEVTNASTTQLLDATTRAWDSDLAGRLGIDPGLLPPLRHPGEVLGVLYGDVLAETGLTDPHGGPVPVVAVGSHDTASAVVGVPADRDSFAYVSCGTWSLVGVELEQPVLTEDSRAANLTNEAGVDGTVRYLRNVMGLWLLRESLRTWADRGEEHDLTQLLAAAAAEPAGRWPVDVDHPSLLPPGDMPARIAALCRETGTPEPETPAQVVRCIVDGLAEGHRRAVDDIRRLTGRDVEVIHVVGGGARNTLLCQATADACGVPVLGGPVEATALGNVLVQARALGVDLPDLAAMRALVRRTQELRRFEPATAPTTPGPTAAPRPTRSSRRPTAAT
ncbi:rhamnulokinase [Aquipuribacter nitratireducens]|uniref:Rhamnulokinase family protein n=1 Tax=Aquipuribacter nitratireducens TaxID=650104 RepID=A0ABW0GHM6_9MICO